MCPHRKRPQATGAAGRSGGVPWTAQGAERSRARLRSLVLVVLLALLVHQAWHYAYLLTFQRFQLYDDEGFFLLSARSVLRGLAVYDEAYFQYGPAYALFRFLLHGPAGVPLTHDANRLTSIVLWLGTALTCALFTWRVAGSIALTVLVLAQSVFALETVSNDPGSPQELCFLLLAGILLLAVPARSRRAESASLAAVGALAAALLLTKANVGALLLLALALALLGLAAQRRSLALVTGALALAAVLLPPLLMRAHLDLTWGRRFALVLSLAVLGVSPFLFGALPRGALGLRGTVALLAGFGASFAAICAFVLARGTSPGGLAHGVVLQHLGFAGAFSIPVHVPDGAVGCALASVALAFVCARGLGRPGARERFARAVAWGKLLFGALLFCLFLVEADAAVLGFLTPFAWLVLVPGSRSRPWTAREARPRVLLALTAVLQMAAGYPVWAARPWPFLFVPLGALCMGDAWRELSGEAAATAPAARATGGLRASVARSLAGLGLPAFVAGVFLLDHHKADLAGLRARYLSFAPLGLPGCDRIRLPRNEVALQRWMVENLRAHASTFLALPGLCSYYLWCGMEPPTGFNAGAWVLLFDEDTQARVVRAARRQDERLCAVLLEEGRVWLDEGREMPSGALVRYIQEEFEPALRCGPYEIRVRAERDRSALASTLLSGRARFASEEDVRPLPSGILATKRTPSIRAWLRTSGPGVLLGYGPGGDLRGRVAAGGAPEAEAARRGAPVLYVGADGRLRGQFWTGEVASMSGGARVDDGAWHHVVLVGGKGEQRLYVDGQRADARAGAIAHERMRASQLGGGNAQGWPGMEPDAASFVGELGEVVLEDRPLTPEEVQRAFALGPPQS